MQRASAQERFRPFSPKTTHLSFFPVPFFAIITPVKNTRKHILKKEPVIKKETYLYSSTWDRLRNEYKIFLLAFLFIIIADSIGQIQIPVGPGTLILFPIFYALLLGVLSGPEALKIFKTKEVKAASKLVIVAICPFIAKLGINAGATIETGIYVAIFVGIPLTQKLYGIMEPKFARLRHEPSEVLTRKAAERQAAAEALTGKENETQEPGKVLTQTTTETAQKKDEEK